MAKAQRSFSVLEPASRVWAVFSDFSRWNRLLVVKNAAVKGWGNQLAPRSAPAAGGALAMLCDGRPAQEWAIEEWSPPAALRLASRRWLGRPHFAMASRISVKLEASSGIETRVRLAIESRFSSLPLAVLLNLVVPLRRELEATLARMEDGLVAQLSGG